MNFEARVVVVDYCTTAVRSAFEVDGRVRLSRRRRRRRLPSESNLPRYASPAAARASSSSSSSLSTLATSSLPSSATARRTRAPLSPPPPAAAAAAASRRRQLPNRPRHEPAQHRGRFLPALDRVPALELHLTREELDHARVPREPSQLARARASDASRPEGRSIRANGGVELKGVRSELKGAEGGD